MIEFRENQEEATKQNFDLELISQGDAQEAAKAVEYYKDYLTNFALKRRPFVAEDVVQEACVRAVTRVSRPPRMQFANELSFKVWLTRIAANIIVDNARRDKLINFVPLETPDNRFGIPIEDSLEDENSMDPLDEVIAKESKKETISRLKLLKPDHHKILWMSYFQDLSNDEISKELQISNGNVRIQLFRARQAYRQAYFKVVRENEETI